MNVWWVLSLAIIAEVVATLALKASEGFTRILPVLIVVIGYATAFYCMSLSLRSIPVGIVYAVWSGIGIVLVAFMSWILYQQALSMTHWFGIGLILAGVVVLNLASTPTHD